MTFSATDITSLQELLGAPAQQSDTSWQWQVRSASALSGKGLVVTLSNATGTVHGSTGLLSVVSVQTSQGYFELHNVTAMMFIEPDEVMFIAKHGEYFSSLVVGSSGTCSQFANVHMSVVRGDITKLDPALLMAAMQLSLAEAFVDSL